MDSSDHYERRIRSALYAAFSLIFLYETTPYQQWVLLPIYTLSVSLAWLVLANIAMPLAVRRVEAVRCETELLLQQQFPLASIGAQLRIYPTEVLQVYWKHGQMARSFTDLSALALNLGLCTLMHKRFVGHIMTRPELLLHQAPLLLSLLLLVVTPSRGQSFTIVLFIAVTASQMYIRVVVEVKGFSLLHELGFLGALGYPFAYACGMISVAPQTASGGWTTALCWTVTMILLDGMLPLHRCWNMYGEAAGYRHPVQPSMLLVGIGMLPHLSAGLMLWYGRAMSELISVQSFLHRRSQRQR